jgi:hypothetical protein
MRRHRRAFFIVIVGLISGLVPALTMPSLPVIVILGGLGSETRISAQFMDLKL